MEIKNQPVLVLGAARSGMAALRVLASRGAKITLNESKPLEALSEREELERLGVEIVAGGQPSELFERDFAFVVKNPGIKYTEWFIERLEDRGIPIYTEIELAYQLASWHHYLAVTGTNGKTTTVTLIGEILKKAFPGRTYVAGNIGTPLCEVLLEEKLDERQDCYLVLEMSNFQLLNIDQFKPEVATIINLTPDHLDYMRSLDEYYASKTRIYMNQDRQDQFVLNEDDPMILEYMKQYPPHASIIPLTMQETKRIGRYHLADGWIMDRDQKVLALDKIQMVGRQNIQNVMIAIAFAKAVGVTNEVINDVISHFPGVEHRVEFVRELDGVRYYNDSKGTNTDATIVAVESFTQPVILLVGGKEKNLPMDELKKHLGHVKQVIGYGACGKRLVDDLVGEEGLYYPTMDEALAKARSLAKAGDVVLLSPTTSSFDQFHSFEERGTYFKKCVMSM